MARMGGYRPGAGRPRTKPRGVIPKDILRDASVAHIQPLEYMLTVMNDLTADETRRDRMAIAAAPFCHPRISDIVKGKKERESEDAAKAGGGEWADDLAIN